MTYRNILPTVIILTVSAFFFVQTFNIASTDVTTISSAMFPRLVLGVIIALTVLTLIQDIRKKGSHKTLAPIHSSLFMVFGLLALLLFLMNFAGFVVAATAFMTLFSLFMTNQWKQPVAIAKSLGINLAISLAIYYLFVHVLLFMLP